MLSRYTDKENLVKNRNDFISRNYSLPITVVVFTFVALFIAVAILQYFLGVHHPGIFLIIIGAALAGIGVVGALSMHHYNDIIMATEFQNAIFSSAAKVNTEFCLIVRNDGSLVYADNGFNNYFNVTQRGKHGIDALLDSDGLYEEDKKRLLDCLQHSESMVMPFHKSTTNLSISIEPLPFHLDQESAINLTVNALDRPIHFH